MCAGEPPTRRRLLTLPALGARPARGIGCFSRALHQRGHALAGFWKHLGDKQEADKYKQYNADHVPDLIRPGASAWSTDWLGPAIQKMCAWGMLKNAQNRVFGGLEANYNQDSIFGPKGGAWQSLIIVHARNVKRQHPKAARRARGHTRPRPTSTSARRTRRQAQAWQAAPELQSEARKALTAVRNCISRDCQVNTPADRVAAAVGTVKQPALSISLNTFQGDICTEADFRSWQSPRPTMACSSGVRNSLLETTRGADSFPPWNEP